MQAYILRIKAVWLGVSFNWKGKRCTWNTLHWCHFLLVNVDKQLLNLGKKEEEEEEEKMMKEGYLILCHTYKTIFLSCVGWKSQGALHSTFWFCHPILKLKFPSWLSKNHTHLLCYPFFIKILSTIFHRNLALFNGILLHAHSWT